MKPAIILSLATAAFLGVAACSTPQQEIAQTEYVLARSGFTVIPEQTSDLGILPADKFVTRTASNGQTEYIYSDPARCNCVYVGNETNHRAFLQAETAAATGLV